MLREDDGNGGNAAESYGIKIDDRFVYSFYSLSVSFTETDGSACDDVKYICTRFILRRKSAFTSHSISVLSL